MLQDVKVAQFAFVVISIFGLSCGDPGDHPGVWAVKLRPGVNAEDLARRHQLVYHGPIGILNNHILVSNEQSLSGRTHEEVHSQLQVASNVVWASVQWPRQQYKRLTFDDPLFATQWHLHNAQTVGIDLNVVPAWEAGFNGLGVGICVADDGLEHTHPDFQDEMQRYNASASYDWVKGTADPSPKDQYDAHGTECAGTAFAGANNHECGVGVAYGASFSGARLISRPVSDATEAQALTKDLDTNHIFSCSWGPYDDGKALVGPGPVMTDALEEASRTGRGGKGTIYVWAGGNGRQNRDNVNYDGYANSIFTIAVAAVTTSGKMASYSEPGAPLLVSAPSSPDGIRCTAVQGRCSTNFGGTSAAAPQVAGVVALILQANPSLTWRDVQEVLLRTARQIDQQNVDWMSNGAGFLVNHNYGFGLVDAARAVLAAQTWQLLPSPRAPLVITSTEGAGTIPQEVGQRVTQTLHCSERFFLEHVEVYVRIAHNYVGQLDITLTSPSGTPSVLFVSHTNNRESSMDWTFSSVRLWGENPQGAWKLEVLDRTPDNYRGQLVGWQLKLHGSDRPAS